MLEDSLVSMVAAGDSCLSAEGDCDSNNRDCDGHLDENIATAECANIAGNLYSGADDPTGACDALAG